MMGKKRMLKKETIEGKRNRGGKGKEKEGKS